MSANPRALRRSERLKVVLSARCRTRSGFVDQGRTSSLSAEGCRCESFALTLNEGDLVVVRSEGLEGLCGRVRWVSRHTAATATSCRTSVPVWMGATGSLLEGDGVKAIGRVGRG